MIFRFVGATAPCLFLGSSFLANGLFQSSIPVELELNHVGVSIDVDNFASLSFLKSDEARLKLSVSDFRPIANTERSDRIMDAISLMRGTAKAKSLAEPIEPGSTSEIDAVFNGSNASRMTRAEIDSSEIKSELASSEIVFGITPTSRPAQNLINIGGENGLIGSSDQTPTRSRNFLANVEGSSRRMSSGSGGSGSGGGSSGAGVVSSGGGPGGGAIGGGGGGRSASTSGIVSIAGIQSSGLSTSSMASNVDQFLSNSASRVASSDLTTGDMYRGTSLLASSARPQLTADGKFGIPNHQYWTFDFKDTTGGPSGTPDGIVDRKDADRHFDNYLAGLRPQLEAASQVVKWNPAELRAIYDDLNTQIPTTDPAKSPSHLTFLIIDFPVKGFYLPKSGIPDNPGLPPGALD